LQRFCVDCYSRHVGLPAIGSLIARDVERTAARMSQAIAP
jgi:hypothetical protein